MRRENEHPDNENDSRPIDKLVDPLRALAAHEASGTIVLLGAGVIALLLANSPLSEAFFKLLELPLTAAAGEFRIEKPLLLWINDGVMGIFFFHVGLEIKREVRRGELSTLRKAALPTIAALGGMLVPAGLYTLLNYGTQSEAGWGIPMATDIAFALGLLALLGDRVPKGLRVFLAALAIVDDLGAVIVIAVFYTEGVSLFSLAIGAVAFAFALGMNLLRVRSAVAYLIVGTVCWVGFLKSGVHATIAAVMMAFTIPGRTRIDGHSLLRRIDTYIDRLKRIGIPDDQAMNTPEQQRVFDEMATDVENAGSPLMRLEHLLVPLVAFLVLPAFALANAGVSLSGVSLDMFKQPVVLGILVGLCVGKPVGVTLLAWLGVKLGWADLPSGVTWRSIAGVSFLAGIGFTMSLFISSLAFDAELHGSAKLGVLSASFTSGIVGWILLRRVLGSRKEEKSQRGAESQAS